MIPGNVASTCDALDFHLIMSFAWGIPSDRPTFSIVKSLDDICISNESPSIKSAQWYHPTIYSSFVFCIQFSNRLVWVRSCFESTSLVVGLLMRHLLIPVISASCRVHNAWPIVSRRIPRLLCLSCRATILHPAVADELPCRWQHKLWSLPRPLDA